MLDMWILSAADHGAVLCCAAVFNHSQLFCCSSVTSEELLSSGPHSCFCPKATCVWWVGVFFFFFCVFSFVWYIRLGIKL